MGNEVRPADQDRDARDAESADQGPEADQDAAVDDHSAVEDDSDSVNLEAALQATEQELTEQREAMLRMQAEMENLRKRLIRDLDRSRKRALESFMNDLLPVRDSLERGLEAADESASVESLREGKALTMKMLGKVMEDHGLVEIDPAGEPFDPEQHEAISMLPSQEYEANTVMEVVQKGYRLHDRLIRPARVVVSGGPPGD